MAPGLGISASAERIHPLSGKVSDESNALTTGISYTGSDVWKASSRLEWQDSSQSRSWLATGAVAAKLGTDWTFLNRGIYSAIDNRGTATGSQHLAQYQTGFAWRPADSNVWNAIGLVGFKRDQDSTLPLGQQIDERALILSMQLNIQPSASWDVSTRLAAKHAQDSANGLVSTGWTQLLGARVTHDIGERWDVGMQAYSTWGIGTRQQALGAELGYLVQRNLWLSVGYNVHGFSDADLTGSAYTQRGIYLRLRFKFGADLFEQAGEASALSAPRRSGSASAVNAAAALLGPSSGMGGEQP